MIFTQRVGTIKEATLKSILLIFLAIVLLIFLSIGLRTAFTLNSSIDEFEEAAIEFQTEWKEYKARVEDLEDKVYWLHEKYVDELNEEP